MYKAFFTFLIFSTIAWCDVSHASRFTIAKDDSWLGENQTIKRRLIGSEKIKYRLCGEGTEPFFPYPVSGISAVEPGLRWTDQKKVIFMMPTVHPLGQIVGITLKDTSAYTTSKNFQKLVVSGDGIAAKEYWFDRKTPTHTFDIVFPESASATEQFHIIMDLPNAAPPGNGDPRSLGLRIPYIIVHLHHFPSIPVEEKMYRLGLKGEVPQLPSSCKFIDSVDYEDGKIWTRGKRTGISFPVYHGGGRVTGVEFPNAYTLVSPAYSQQVTVRIGDASRTYRYDMDSNEQHLSIEFPKTLTDTAEVFLETPDSCAPAMTNPEWAADTRDLGLALQRVKLKVADAERHPIDRIRFRMAATGEVPQLPAEIQFTGFADAELGHRWMNGKRGSFRIPLRFNGGFIFGMRLLHTTGLLSEKLSQKLIVRMKGVEMEYNYNMQNPMHSPEIIFPDSLDGFADVQLEMPNACLASVIYPGNGDPRELSILMNIVELYVRKPNVVLPSIGKIVDINEMIETQRRAKIEVIETETRERLRKKKTAFLTQNMGEVFGHLVNPDNPVVNPDNPERKEAQKLLEELFDLFPENLTHEQLLITLHVARVEDVIAVVAKAKPDERLAALQGWLNNHREFKKRIAEQDAQAERTRLLYAQIPGSEPVVLTGNPDGFPHRRVCNFGDQYFNQAQRLLNSEDSLFEVIDLGHQYVVLVKTMWMFSDKYISFNMEEVVNLWQPSVPYADRAYCKKLLNDRLHNCRFFQFGDCLWGIPLVREEKLRFLWRTPGFEISGDNMRYMLESFKRVHQIKY